MNILFALPKTTNFLLWDISINTQIIDLKELELRDIIVFENKDRMCIDMKFRCLIIAMIIKSIWTWFKEFMFYHY